MATLNIKALSAGFSLFALFMVGTISAKANTHEGDKKEKEVKAETEKVVINQTWFYTSGDPTLESSYSSSANPNCGNGDDVICEILAPANPTDPTKPHMTPQVVSDINDALAGSPEENDTVQSFRAE